MEQYTKQRFREKQSISQDLVGYIKQQIAEGELHPGDRIVETKLAKDLGISQTPVREAIRQLCGEGVITIIPNKGPVVRTLTMKDVFEIYSLRAVLEGLAIRMAIHNASDEDVEQLKAFYEEMKRKEHDPSVETLLPDSLHIHQTIVTLSKHDRLISTYQSISFQISIVNRMMSRASTKRKEVEQHAELVEALASRNPDEAEMIIRRHIFRTYKEFAKVNTVEHPDYGEDIWF